MKRCSKCNNIKDLTLFYRDNACKDGRRSQCKACDNKRRVGSSYVKNYNLKHLYGIDITQYKLLKQEHNASCAICGVQEKDIGYSLCVDHNHSTKTVRGLLCKPCNLVVGNSRESVDVLSKAIEYLRRYEKDK